MKRYKVTTPKRNDNEHQIQKEYFKILSLNENEFPELAFIFAVPNGSLRNIRVAVKLKAEGVKRGVPDIMIPIMTSKQFGHNMLGYSMGGCFLETKTEKGVMSKEQKAYRLFLIEQGYEHIICRSVSELVSATENYLGITFKNK